MKKRLKIGSRFLVLSAQLQRETKGVNSNLKDGLHCLLWDFDEPDAQRVTLSLTALQHEFSLPSIYVFDSGNGQGYHAYCLHRMAWADAVRVIASTPHVDLDWLGFCLIRRYLTLRFQDKPKRKIDYLATLIGKEKATVDWGDLRSFSHYMTKPE